MSEINLILPYPPTVNHYWYTRTVFKNNKTMIQHFVGKKGMQYRKDVAKIVLISKLQRFGEAILRLEAKMYPPDKRRRDIDNICKACLDSLQYAGVYNDDAQIHQLYIEKFASQSPGRIEVKITKI